MDERYEPLREVGDGSQGAWRDEVVRDVSTVQLAWLTDGRNAWHSTWVRSYVPSQSLFVGVNWAAAAAQLRRKQGSVFYIRDVPALRVHGTTTDLLLLEPQTFAPLHSWNGMTEVLGRPVRERTLGLVVDLFDDGDQWREWLRPGVSTCAIVRAGTGLYSLRTRSLTACRSVARHVDWLDWMPIAPRRCSRSTLYAVERAFARDASLRSEGVVAEGWVSEYEGAVAAQSRLHATEACAAAGRNPRNGERVDARPAGLEHLNKRRCRRCFRDDEAVPA